MLRVTTDNRVLTSSLAGFLADDNTKKHFGKHWRKSNHEVAKATSQFFAQEEKHPLINFVEGLYQQGAGPVMLHSLSIALDHDLSEYVAQPRLPSVIPNEVREQIMKAFQPLAKDFHDTFIKEYLQATKTQWDKALGACRDNLQYVEDKYLIFARLRRFAGLKDKAMAVLPCPLEFFSGGIGDANTAYCTLGWVSPAYTHQFETMSTAELARALNLFVHEFFHHVVGCAMQDDEQKGFFDLVRKEIHFGDSAFGFYKEGATDEQLDETVTQALTMGLMCKVLGQEACQQAIEDARKAGFLGSIKVMDKCQEHFAL